jgi:hypothetical protein
MRFKNEVAKRRWFGDGRDRRAGPPYNITFYTLVWYEYQWMYEVRIGDFKTSTVQGGGQWGRWVVWEDLCWNCIILKLCLSIVSPRKFALNRGEISFEKFMSMRWKREETGVRATGRHPRLPHMNNRRVSSYTHPTSDTGYRVPTFA